MAAAKLPADGRSIYRVRESRRCNRPTCTRCPHGPYWIGYWYADDGTLQHTYVGRDWPTAQRASAPATDLPPLARARGLAARRAS